MTHPNDALAFAGFAGCASDREFHWHLGSDTPSQWNRWPGLASWIWHPDPDCSVRPLDGPDIVRDLVMGGGWLILGDSISEGHFFSLSCTLFPHVIATPNYTQNPYFDRAWPQHLYLSPSSPLIPLLQKEGFPPGYSIADTPLVTFRRVDLLMSQEELNELYARRTPTPLSSQPNRHGPLSPLRIPPPSSLSPLPLPPSHLHYSTLILSTAGHWTTTLLHAFRDESLGDDAGYGIAGVLGFFERAMAVWAGRVQEAVDEYNRGKSLIFVLFSNSSLQSTKPTSRRPKTVVVRAYLPGHEDCHDQREPWTEVLPYRWKWYNWPWVGEFNRVFENILSSPSYPDIHFLPIDRPARLRPDAHATGDCLHIIAGPGVLEGWTHYMWHYVTREVGAWVR
ncbi:hypothetical protein SERLA73DRAFT_168148 [Serpula lacrymans var. lacrymans S7.3]|uniref:Uncharacterized protein n=1 Tax=Serpula lacrymans var. lacrymans (strain S7.3) TaxID=936435 RepID=F8PWQ1_SERL3|nr:hypothetical protein SERLA73DRAFT_168148 [Serpula lacrymans var. lacrymans S7.3]